MATSSEVADFLIVAARERGENLTNLKLQKLLYYAQAWFLAIHDRPLFDEEFQAWVHGPVAPSQYRRFKDAEWRPILLEIRPPTLTKIEVDHLLEVLDVFGTESALALERMTHAEQPWQEARGDLAPHESSTAVISAETMKKFYKAMQKD